MIGGNSAISGKTTALYISLSNDFSLHDERSSLTNHKAVLTYFGNEKMALTASVPALIIIDLFRSGCLLSTFKYGLMT